MTLIKDDKPIREREFIGLSKKKGQDLAERKNMIFQLVRVGEEKFFDYPHDPLDVRLDRVYVEIDAGQIVKAKII